MQKQLINGDLITTDSIPATIKDRALSHVGDWNKDSIVYNSAEHTTQGVNETNCVGHAVSRMLAEMGVSNTSPQEIFHFADLIDNIQGEGSTILAGVKAALELYPDNVAGYVELSPRAIGPWLTAIGPVVIALPWYAGFQNARGGIMRPSAAKELKAGAQLTRHACTVIGYDPHVKTCLGRKPMFLIHSATWSHKTSTAWLPEPLLYRYLIGMAIGIYTPEQMIRD